MTADASSAACHRLQHLRDKPASITTKEVVAQVIVPMTTGAKCRFVELPSTKPRDVWSPDKNKQGDKPLYFVSHGAPRLCNAHPIHHRQHHRCTHPRSIIRPPKGPLQ